LPKNSRKDQKKAKENTLKKQGKPPKKENRIKRKTRIDKLYK